jgi:drug/metabolite transporter (DMT)-like permease
MTSLAQGARPAPATHLLGALAITLTGLIWSAGGLFFRMLENEHLWPILVWRYLCITLFFGAIVAWRTRGRLFAFWRTLGWRVLPGSLFFAGASLFFLLALDATTVFNALMMLALQPLLAAGLAWLALREPVKPVTWLAMAVALGGIYLMLADSLEGGGFVGNLLALGSSLSFAAYTVFNRWVGAVDTAPFIMVGGVIGALVALGVSLGQGVSLGINANDVMLCAAMSTLLGVGFLLFNWAVRLVPAAEALVLAQTEVIFGPLWVWLVFAERPTEAALLGGLVLFAAVLVQAAGGFGRRARVIPPPAEQP